jgi:uncharacterized protein
MRDFLDAGHGLPLTLDQLWVYPVKSCAGIRVAEATLLDTGLEWDRAWMVVDERGEFVSQRELPRMALVQPAFRGGQLELQAPGMRSLHLLRGAAEAPCKVRIWDDEVDAFDMGELAAQWFTDALLADRPHGLERLRLVRFDPACVRPSDVRWTGGRQAPQQFGDGFPLLVLSQASLDDLNQRLALLGQPPVGVERFRPNLVLGGLQAHDEDRLAGVRLGDAVALQPTKPCARCTIPDVDPQTGVACPREVSGVLQAYRQDRRLDGAITFGMNAIVREGRGLRLFEGMGGLGHWGAWR